MIDSIARQQTSVWRSQIFTVTIVITTCISVELSITPMQPVLVFVLRHSGTNCHPKSHVLAHSRFLKNHYTLSCYLLRTSRPYWTMTLSNLNIIWFYIILSNWGNYIAHVGFLPTFSTNKSILLLLLLVFIIIIISSVNKTKWNIMSCIDFLPDSSYIHHSCTVTDLI